MFFIFFNTYCILFWCNFMHIQCIRKHSLHSSSKSNGQFELSKNSKELFFHPNIRIFWDTQRMKIVLAYSLFSLYVIRCYYQVSVLTFSAICQHHLDPIDYPRINSIKSRTNRGVDPDPCTMVGSRTGIFYRLEFVSSFSKGSDLDLV